MGAGDKFGDEAVTKSGAGDGTGRGRKVTVSGRIKEGGFVVGCLH